MVTETYGLNAQSCRDLCVEGYRNPGDQVRRLGTEFNPASEKQMNVISGYLFSWIVFFLNDIDKPNGLGKIRVDIVLDKNFIDKNRRLPP